MTPRSRALAALTLALGAAISGAEAQEIPVIEWLQPRPSGNQINAIATRGTRWVTVGDAGTATVSIDAGVNWKAYSTPTAAALRGVVFLDSLRLLAGGDGGVLLASHNGGVEWRVQPSGTANELRAFATTPGAVVAVGARGTILRSLDSGVTWQPQRSGVTRTLRGLAEAASTVLVAVGTSGTIVRSTDGGVTWTRGASRTRAALRAVHFVDARLGVAVGGDDLIWRAKRVVLFTSDGGVTWSKATAPRGGRLYALAGDADRIVAVGEGGAVIESRDAGATWSSVPNTGTLWLGAAHLPAPGTIVALGARGQIAETSDAGKTWTSRRAGTWGAFGSVAEPSPGTLLLGHGASILRSVDGGQSFARLIAADSIQGIADIEFADPQRGVAALTRGGVLMTVDGGRSWTRSAFPFPQRPSRSVHHAADRRWFAVRPASNWGRDGDDWATIFRSDDDGATWTGCTCGGRGPMSGIDFNGDVGMIVGGGGVIVRTADRGTTWARAEHRLTRALLMDVAVIDSRVAVVVGSRGIVLRTADGGATWARIASGTTQPLWAAQSLGSTVVAGGGNGTLLLSRDAGLTWRVLHVPVSADIIKLFLRSADEVLVTGVPFGALRVWLTGASSPTPVAQRE